MDPQEPAGCEGGEGKSAELFTRARARGGSAGNTCRTVCGLPQVRYLLQSETPEAYCTVGRSVSLPTFSFSQIQD